MPVISDRGLKEIRCVGLFDESAETKKCLVLSREIYDALTGWPPAVGSSIKYRGLSFC
jgi:hypothetical protein